MVTSPLPTGLPPFAPAHHYKRPASLKRILQVLVLLILVAVGVLYVWGAQVAKERGQSVGETSHELS